MTINAVVQWSILAASLCNAILLLWLGLTVLLNAERRGWGIWLAGSALGSGALFFLIHTGIISLGLERISPGVIARWPLAWVAGFALPCAWYLVMLWYGGFWTHWRSLRHTGWHVAFQIGVLLVIAGTGILSAPALSMMLKSFPPAFILSGPMMGTVPLLALIYALLVIGCVGMALDILLFPAPASRLMGDLARRRARPWLIATSLVLLAVSLLLGWMLLRVAPGWFDASPRHIPRAIWHTLVGSDLLITLGVSLAVLLLGKAITAYELFTGTTLPRGGMRSQWRHVVMIAVAFGATIAATLVSQVPSIYILLLTTVLLTVFYALQHWRSYAERERFMAALRPFAGGPRLTEALGQGEDSALTAGQPFHALCDKVLGTRWACLAASGPFATLVAPLTHPTQPTAPGIPATLIARCTDPRTLCFPVNGEVSAEATWAVPLWGSRGSIGLLLLGEKRDGGLYTREEMEIARSVGERLIDALAGAQMARRLLQVQRARLADDQLADRRTRRVIHDDILPQIHTLMLALSAEAAQQETVAQLADLHHTLAALLRELPATAVLEISHHGVVGALRAYCERTHAEAFTAQAWEIDPAADARLRSLSPLVAEVVFSAAREAIRNAARYGRGADPQRPLTLTVRLTDTVPPALVIADDGVGLAHPATSSGSGQGTLLHSAMMAIIGGAWIADSACDAGTRVTLVLPGEG